ncbi:MAG TPA: PEGA domain-containing protein, partial [Gemmatimonadales bacterium]
MRPPARWRRAAMWSTVALATLGAGAAIAARRPPAAANGMTPVDTNRVASAPPVQPYSRPVRQTPAATGTGKLRLKTDPPNAVIYVDGDIVDTGFSVDRVIAAGERRIEVRANGYQRYVRTVSVARDASVNLGLVTLQPATARP